VFLVTKYGITVLFDVFVSVPDFWTFWPIFINLMQTLWFVFSYSETTGECGTF
jgi:hypothetical protein